jgi:hypothetical protein
LLVVLAAARTNVVDVVLNENELGPREPKFTPVSPVTPLMVNDVVFVAGGTIVTATVPVGTDTTSPVVTVTNCICPGPVVLVTAENG